MESDDLDLAPTGPETARLTSDRWAWLLLLGACAVGLGRFLRLGRWSLWYDEAITWADANHALDAGQLYNPAGYRAIRATVEWLGGVPDEFALRLLPALLGWLAIPLTYWAFRPGAGRTRAAVAAAIVAASPWQLYWSQNARFYTMAQALGLLGGGLLLRALFGSRQHDAPALEERSAPARAAPLYVLAGAALVGVGALFHLQNILLLAVFVCAPWLLRPLGARLSAGGRRAALLLGGLALLGLLARLPWALDVWSTYEGKKSGGSVVSRLSHFALSTGFYLSPLLAIAFLVSSWGALRARDSFFVFTGVLVVLGLAAAGVASLLARVTAQYVFVFSPWVALVATWPIGRARESRPATSVLAFGYSALLIAPLLVSSALYLTVRHGERPRWREAYEYVWNHRGAEDLILGMAAPVGEYYLSAGATDLRQPERVAWLDGFRAAVPHRWGRHARRTWFVIRPDYLEDWPAEDRERMRRLLREECHLMQRFPVTVEGRGLSLDVYMRP
ncbi:MAG: hypothetical protein ACI8QZ_002674 [Chlamydiales bacterium]|jgi:hypothetical protein